MVSQFVGALFIHVANLEYYILSLGTERVMYLGSLGLVLGGMGAGAGLCHYVGQAVKNVANFFNEATMLKDQAQSLKNRVGIVPNQA